MFWVIVRKEFRELWRSGQFRWSAALLAVVLTAALVDGWQRYQEAIRSHVEMQKAERERWLNQGNKHPHSAAHQGFFVFRPQLSAAAVDPGIDPYVGQAVYLEAHRQQLFRFRPAEDSTAARRMGELTAAVTLQKLVPLLIILLAFGAFSREREDGTLRLVLGAGVPARTLGRAKAAGLMLPILILLVPVTIAGVLALWLGSDNGVTVPLLPRLAVTASAYLLYFGIFIAVTLAVSARAGTSRQALTFLLVFWFVNCLLLPPVVIDLARRVHPAPTALDFAASLREGKMQLPVWYEQLGSIERDLLERYGKKDVSELPISANGVAMVAEEDDYNVVQEKHYGALYAAQLSQNRFYSAAGFLAPLLALQPLSMGLAGTDFAQHADFAMAAESYRQEFVQMMNRDLITNEMEHRKTPLPYPGVTTRFYQPGRELWETVPPFSYSFFGPGRVFQNHWLSLVYLCGWMLASLWLAARAVSRLEVN